MVQSDRISGKNTQNLGKQQQMKLFSAISWASRNGDAFYLYHCPWLGGHRNLTEIQWEPIFRKILPKSDFESNEGKHLRFVVSVMLPFWKSMLLSKSLLSLRPLFLCNFQSLWQTVTGSQHYSILLRLWVFLCGSAPKIVRQGVFWSGFRPRFTDFPKNAFCFPIDSYSYDLLRSWSLWIKRTVRYRKPDGSFLNTQEV